MRVCSTQASTAQHAEVEAGVDEQALQINAELEIVVAGRACKPMQTSIDASSSSRITRQSVSTLESSSDPVGIRRSADDLVQRGARARDASAGAE